MVARRDPGVLGAPKAISLSRFSLGLFIPVIVLGVYLPLFGASLLVVLLIEKLLLSRIPRVRHWLGLTAPVQSA